MPYHKVITETIQLRTEQVLRALDSEAPEPPRHSFTLSSAEEWKTAAKSSCIIGICVFLKRAYKAYSEGSSPLFFIILTVLTLAYMLFLAMGHTIASISEEVINVKGKCYHSSSIERMIVYGINYISLYSGGRRILKVPISDPGCEELVKWARYCGIPIEKTDGSEPGKGMRVVYAAAGLTVMAVVAGSFIYFSFK